MEMLPPLQKILQYLFLITAGTFGPASLREQGDVDGQDKEQWRVSKIQENSVCSSATKPWADTSVWRSLVFCNGPRQVPGRGHLAQGNTETPRGDPAVWAAKTSLGLQRLQDTCGGTKS